MPVIFIFSTKDRDFIDESYFISEVTIEYSDELESGKIREVNSFGHTFEISGATSETWEILVFALTHVVSGIRKIENFTPSEKYHFDRWHKYGLERCKISIVGKEKCS